MSRLHDAAKEIVRAANTNPHVTVAALQDELARGDVWVELAIRHDLTLAQWSAAMQMAIDELREAPTKNQ